MEIFRSSNVDFIPASHEDPKNPGVLKKVMFTKENYNAEGRLQMINWALLPRGNSFKAHYHEDMEETFIILNGSAMITVDEETEMLNAGDAVFIPTKAVHKMENNSNEDVQYIAIGVSQGKNGKTVSVE